MYKHIVFPVGNLGNVICLCGQLSMVLKVNNQMNCAQRTETMNSGFLVQINAMLLIIQENLFPYPPFSHFGAKRLNLVKIQLCCRPIISHVLGKKNCNFFHYGIHFSVFPTNTILLKQIQPFGRITIICLYVLKERPLFSKRKTSITSVALKELLIILILLKYFY